MMSEKAKGKQRAVDSPELSGDASSSSATSASAQPSDIQSRKAVVRFTDSSIADLNLVVRQKDLVHFVKARIRDERPQLKDKRLRLIFNGRLLTDADTLYPLLPDDDAPKWIHCSVGATLAAGESDTDKKAQRAQIRPARGFDRLATLGFSESDIANFRRQFHSHSSADYIDSADFATDEEYEEHARALEEQWIDSAIESNTPIPTLSPASSSPGSSESTTLRGTLIGFFFPILPLFFLKESSPPPVFWENGAEFESHTVIFDRRISMAIVVGFLMNVLFGLWRFLLEGS